MNVPRVAISSRFVLWVQNCSIFCVPAKAAATPLAARENRVEGLDVWTRWKARNRSFGFVAVLVLIAASHDVLAQALPAANLSPTVPTGKKRMVGFFTGLNPDCSSTG